MRATVYTGPQGRAERIRLVEAMADYTVTMCDDPCEGCDEHLGAALRAHRRTIWRAKRPGERWHYYGTKAQALSMIGRH